MAETKREERHLRLSPITLILSLLLGVMLAIPLKVIKQQSEGEQPSAQDEQAALLADLEQENQQLRAELAQMREQADSLEVALLEREEASAELAEARTRYRIMAGLEAVQGPGIRLTLTEGVSGVPPGGEAAPYLIHQQDLLNIVNELWLAGAEAIAIRSGNRVERLVLDSSIRCVGSLIDVNNTRMTPPFDIFAIGDPDSLYSAVTMPGGVLEPLRFWNIQAEVVRLDDIQLPAYQGSMLLEYARPVEEE